MTRSYNETARAVIGFAAAIGVAGAACGSSDGGSTFPGGRSGNSGLAGSLANSGSLASSGVLGSAGGLSDSGAATGSLVDTRCSGGATTTISGTVYDPADLDPLYNVTVFVPDSGSPPPALARTGASCAACTDLYPSTVTAAAVTDEKGHFTLSMTPGGPLIPTGANVPLYVQTGKWRMKYTIANVTQCVDNPQPDKMLHLPADGTEGDLPDIAISTGSADSLECLPMRIGVNPSEYTAGGSLAGHIHLYQGAGGASTANGAPASYEQLWDSTADLQKNDIVLLSCEGAETAHMNAANQQSLSDYAKAGGRVFASHFHYAWFNSGVFATSNLASWTPGGNHIDDSMPFPGNVVTTLNVGGAPFPEGIAMKAWLSFVGALTNGQLPVWYARHNADVTPMNTPSQPWIVFDGTVPQPGTNSTQYFSFDTPIGASAGATCGRVVYSDLHVSGGPGKAIGTVMADYANGGGGGFGGGPQGGRGLVAPSGCASHPLTPQEKALEFMLFDLSSCLQTVGQPQTVPMLPPPK